MKKTIAQPILIVGSLLVLQGCYTQLATYDEPAPYASYEPEYPTTDETAENGSPDSLVVDDSSAVTDEWTDDRRPQIGFDYYYPAWYPPVVMYDPWYSWDPWGCTVAYPWWWNRPYYGWTAFGGWYYYDHGLYASHGHSGWYRPEGPAVTRTSGTRRSGSTTRRDYDGVRSMSVGGGSSAGSIPTRGTSTRGDVRAATPSTAGRNAASGTATRPAPSTTRTRSSDRQSSAPSRSWSLPELFGRPSGSSSGSSGSSSSSSGGSDRSAGRGETVSRPAPSAPAPSPAPSRSSSPPPSSNGGSRSSGTTRSR